MNESKRKLFDENGALIPDPTPIEIAAELQMPSSNLFEMVREAVRSEGLRRAAEEAGDETFEEADDFDVGEDFDPNSPWEGDFDTPLDVLVEEYRERLIARRAGGAPPSSVPGQMDPPSSAASSKENADAPASSAPPNAGT